MEIPVTQAHIDNGTPRSFQECPIAHAIREAGNWWKVSVSPYNIALGCANIRPTVTLADWIDRFDQGRKVKPFTLRLTHGLNGHGMAEMVGER